MHGGAFQIKSISLFYFLNSTCMDSLFSWQSCCWRSAYGITLYMCIYQLTPALVCQVWGEDPVPACSCHDIPLS